MNIKEWWTKTCEEHKSKKAAYKLEQLKDKSEESVDVCVTDGELWLWYDGHPVCPMRLFKDGENPSAVIGVIRTYFVEKRK